MLASQTSVPNPPLHTAFGDDSESTATEQHVTYPDGIARMEMVQWDDALQIYYWKSQVDYKRYFEDPLNGDAMVCVGICFAESSSQKLLNQFELGAVKSRFPAITGLFQLASKPHDKNVSANHHLSRFSYNHFLMARYTKTRRVKFL